MQSPAHRLVHLTERLLTWRARRKAIARHKQKQKNVIVDWIEAFLWAAVYVLVINQFLLQAYQIPSGSMIRTLMLQDRIFVNKMIYGPELLPGLVKLPGFVEPSRNEIIIFENPSYIGRGPVFDIVQRVIYMLTLSLVDIDRDELGQPRAHFLIKRAVGVAGDELRNDRGNLLIRPAGADRWYAETEYQTVSGYNYGVERLLTPADYLIIETAGHAIARQDLGLPLGPADVAALNRLNQLGYGDPFALDASRARVLYAAQPNNERVRERVQFARTGWYVPSERVMPLGDNRDNSRDGRYFGAVRVNRVLGRAMFIYWPFDRIMKIR